MFTAHRHRTGLPGGTCTGAAVERVSEVASPSAGLAGRKCGRVGGFGPVGAAGLLLVTAFATAQAYAASHAEDLPVQALPCPQAEHWRDFGSHFTEVHFVGRCSRR